MYSDEKSEYEILLACISPLLSVFPEFFGDFSEAMCSSYKNWSTFRECKRAVETDLKLFDNGSEKFSSSLDANYKGNV